MEDDTSASSTFIPISDLTTYFPHWVIKARVIKKSSKQQLKSGKMLFQTELMDDSGAAILAKYWGNAAEKWYSTVEVGKVYSFSRGRISVANRQYNSVSHNYELTFFAESEIYLVEDDKKINYHRTYTFTPIRSIKNSKNATPFLVNVIGIVRASQPISKIKKKDGVEISNCSVTLVDDTEVEFTINFWEESSNSYTRCMRQCFWQSSANAENAKLSGLKDTVVSLGDIRVTDRANGRVGTFTGASTVFSSSKHPRAQELSQWYQKVDKSSSFETMMSSASENVFGGNFTRSNVESISRASQGRFTATVRIARILWRKKGEESLVYSACVNCGKKVTNDGTNHYKCEACDAEMAQPLWKYFFGAIITDHTGAMVVQIFNNAGVQLLDVDASEIHSWDQERKEEFFEKEMLFKHCTVSIVSRPNTFSGEERVSSTVSSVTPIDYDFEVLQMMNFISEKLSLNVESPPKKIAKLTLEQEANDIKMDENDAFEGNYRYL